MECEETDAEKFQAISSAINQMTRLTEDLLFLARHDNIPNHIKETVNLSSILNNFMPTISAAING